MVNRNLIKDKSFPEGTILSWTEKKKKLPLRWRKREKQRERIRWIFHAIPSSEKCREWDNRVEHSCLGVGELVEEGGDLWRKNAARGDKVEREGWGGYYSQFISRPLSLVYFVASVLKGILAAVGSPDRYLGERASAFCLAPAFLTIRHDSSYNNPLWNFQ